MTKKKVQDAVRIAQGSNGWFREFINTTLLPLLAWAVYWIDTGVVIVVLELYLQQGAPFNNETLLLVRMILLLAIAPLPLVGVPVMFWYSRAAAKR